MTPKWRARAAALLGAGTAVLLASMLPMPAGASSFVSISGSGSSWASVAIDLSEDEAISLMSRAGKSSGLAAEVSRWPRPAPSITYPATSGVTRTAWSPWPAIPRKG